MAAGTNKSFALAHPTMVPNNISRSQHFPTAFSPLLHQALLTIRTTFTAILHPTIYFHSYNSSLSYITIFYHSSYLLFILYCSLLFFILPLLSLFFIPYSLLLSTSFIIILYPPQKISTTSLLRTQGGRHPRSSNGAFCFSISRRQTPCVRR